MAPSVYFIFAPTKNSIFCIFLLAPKGPKICKRAGAELCQAQDKLGLAKQSLPSKKLSLASSYIDVIFPLTNIEVVFNFPKYRGCIPFSKINIIFNLTKYWGCLPFLNILSSSSICENSEFVFHLTKY